MYRNIVLVLAVLLGVWIFKPELIVKARQFVLGSIKNTCDRLIAG